MQTTIPWSKQVNHFTSIQADTLLYTRVDAGIRGCYARVLWRDDNYCCAEKCEDKDGQCGANHGWPKSWCTDKFVFNGMMYDTVNTKCPKMCGHCGQ